MILGYATEFSVNPQATLELHFSADADGTQARIHFYRFGATASGSGWTHVGDAGPFTIDHVPAGPPDSSWGWPITTFAVPALWKTGVYVALALDVGIDGLQVDPETHRFEQVLFVVKNATPGAGAHILYKVPFLTYAAYNGAWLAGAAGMYSSLYQAGPVTLQRPGVGADPWDVTNVDHEDSSSPRQTFAHWDGKMIAWLERNNYLVDYCTDVDVHRDATLVSKYCLLLSAGHDEYWTDAMRLHVEAFIAAGGNVAFFSGNTVWWRVTLTESPGDLLMNRNGWPSNNLETKLTGVSYLHGSGLWSNTSSRDPVGYTVQHPNHWVFQGTGLADGAVFGANERLVGYECDGAALLPEVPGQPRQPSFSDGTPSSFLVLGWATTPGWDAPDQGNEPTMGLYTNGGIVFTASTTDWPRVLEGGNAAVDRITKNVLNRLMASHVKIVGPSVKGLCNHRLVAVGVTAAFHVSGAPSGSTIAWEVTGGTIVGPSNKTKVLVKMPAGPHLVTISVTVTNTGSACPGFATLSIRPLRHKIHHWMQALCHLRHLMTIAVESKRGLPAVRDKVPGFVDPLWDPIRGEVYPPPAADLRALKAQAEAFIKLIDQALSDDETKKSS